MHSGVLCFTELYVFSQTASGLGAVATISQASSPSLFVGGIHTYPTLTLSWLCLYIHQSKGCLYIHSDITLSDGVNQRLAALKLCLISS